MYQIWFRPFNINSTINNVLLNPISYPELVVTEQEWTHHQQQWWDIQVVVSTPNEDTWVQKQRVLLLNIR